MAAAAILDFSHFKFLTVGQLKRAKLRRYTKFGRNRSNIIGVSNIKINLQWSTDGIQTFDREAEDKESLQYDE